MTQEQSNPAATSTPLPAPIRRLRAQARVVAAASAIAMPACIWWTLARTEYPQITRVTLATPSEVMNATLHVPLNLAAFDAVIWRAPEVQVVAQQSRAQTRPPPAPKLGVDLIAITSDYSDSEERSVHRAALYDPIKNKLYQLVTGNQVNGYTLTLIDAGAVTFTFGEHEATLKLRTDQPLLKLGKAQR